MRERLQKILARAGYGSRRSSESLITEGRVRVNDEVVQELGAQADPGVDRIEVDGTAITLPDEHSYFAMNKPYGFVTTTKDPQRRRTVMDLLPPELAPHLFPIGRLDRDTEGLLLFTNDGEFAHRMAHPRYEIEKEYFALVERRPSEDALNKLRSGVDVRGSQTAPAQAERAAAPAGYEMRDGHTWLRIIIHEGRKRQIRLMCAGVGHPVRALVRTRIGDVLLGRLAKGKVRPLSKREVEGLKQAVGLPH